MLLISECPESGINVQESESRGQESGIGEADVQPQAAAEPQAEAAETKAKPRKKGKAKHEAGAPEAPFGRHPHWDQRVKTLQEQLPRKVPRERDLLIYKAVVFENTNQTTLAELFGITQARVSQIVQEVRAWKSTMPCQIPGMTVEQQINLATHETREWLEVIRDKALARHDSNSSSEQRHDLGDYGEKTKRRITQRSHPLKPGFLNLALQAINLWGKLGGAGEQWKQWKRKIEEELAGYTRDQESGAGGQEPGANGRLYSQKRCVSAGGGESRCPASRSANGKPAQVEQTRPGKKRRMAYNPFQPDLAAAEEQAAADADADRKTKAAWSAGDPCPEQVPLVTRPEVDRAVEVCQGSGVVIVDLTRSWTCGRLQKFSCELDEGPKILEEMAFVPLDPAQPTRLREPLRTVASPLTSEQRWDILEELGDVGVAVVDLDGQWHRAPSLAECNLSRDGTVIFRVIAHTPLFEIGLGDGRRRENQLDELKRLVDPAGDEAHAKKREVLSWRGGVLSYERPRWDD